MTLFRVYENGKPAKIDHFLKMDPSGAKEGDLVFVSGNPGRTRRIFTKDAIEFQRDVSMPRVMNLLRRKEILLQQFGLKGPEQKRRAKDDLFGIQNSRKAYTGMLLGIQDPSFVEAKAKEEAELKKAIAQIQSSQISQTLGTPSVMFKRSVPSGLTSLFHFVRKSTPLPRIWC